ncbi:MAG: Crp/Fnr family transcriptional regulator [Myxococcaceae bacterium]|nr:Crp/Fnr family transcriptional regulator [Myxococcaceae bacterium]
MPSLFPRPAAEVLAALSAQTTRALLERSTVVSLTEGQALLEVGDEVRVAGLVLEGTLREVYLDEQGDERTRGFSFQGDFVGAWADVLARRPSRTRVEALSTARVRCYDVRTLLEVEARAPDLQRALRLVAERLYVRKSDREFELLTMSAAQRYDALLAQVPEVEALVQLRHIASYLGITPVYLSRLRRQRRAGARPRRG